MSETRTGLPVVPRRRAEDLLRRATDRIEHEAIGVTFDVESDRAKSERVPALPYATIARICLTFALSVRARGGRL